MVRPSQASAPLWQAEITVPKSAAALFESVFQDAASLSTAPAGKSQTRLCAVYNAAPVRSVMETTLAIAAAAARVPPPALTLAPLETRDWVAEGLKRLDAVSAGRVLVHGMHLTPPPRAGRIELKVDAGMAFGTGHHATTAGCLSAIQTVVRRHRVLRALDMGCGTGVLGMAMTRLGVKQVTAADIDPVAVAVTRANARINRIGSRLCALVADSYDAPAIRAAAPFDLVVANILARPLVAMAPSLSRILAPGGTAILSGLMANQHRLVLNAHRAVGLALEFREVRAGWVTLTLISRASRLR